MGLRSNWFNRFKLLDNKIEVWDFRLPVMMFPYPVLTLPFLLPTLSCIQSSSTWNCLPYAVSCTCRSLKGLVSRISRTTVVSSQYIFYVNPLKLFIIHKKGSLHHACVDVILPKRTNWSIVEHHWGLQAIALATDATPVPVQLTFLTGPGKCFPSFQAPIEDLP